MPQIVWTANVEGWIDWYNARWYAYTGQTPEEASGWGWQAVHHPDDFAEVMQRWPTSIATGEPFEMEFRLRGADGVFRWFLTRALPLRDGAGSVVRWVGTNTDIDEQKKREARLRFLGDASHVLTRTLNLPDTMDALLRIVVPTHADWAAVYLVEESGRVSRMAEHHGDDAPDGVARALEILETTAPSGRGAVATALRTGRAQLDANVRCRSHDDERCKDVVSSRIAVPFFVGGTSIGALVAYTTTPPRRYGENDLELFEELARRAALAITNARSFERERHVAAVLQEASLPRILPRVDHLHLDAVYRPGNAEARIGGDWYDAFALPDGRVALTIGDVFGSGLRAAVTMTKLRQAMQSAALIHPDTNAMLDAADRTLRMHDSDGYATAIAAIFDPVSHVVTFSSAGHTGPLLRMADGTVLEHSSPGTLLGLRAPGEAGSAAIPVPAGSVLVFFTDGLFEATKDLFEGFRRVHEAIGGKDIAGFPRPAQAIADAVLGPGGGVDDVAVLTATVLFARDELRPAVASAGTAGRF